MTHDTLYLLMQIMCTQREQEDDGLKRDLDRQGSRISKLKEFVKSKSGKGGLDDSDDEGPARDEDEHNE